MICQFAICIFMKFPNATIFFHENIPRNPYILCQVSPDNKPVVNPVIDISSDFYICLRPCCLVPYRLTSCNCLIVPQRSKEMIIKQ